jgi:hypothetical protein
MNTCTHSERPAAARCVVCGEVLCHDCRLQKKGRNYCRACVPGKVPGYRSPTFSMLLSLVPGLGQMHAGSPLKGVALLAAAGACLAWRPEVPWVLPLSLWLFAMWDARMTALKRNFQLRNGRSGSPGAGEGDWMLIAGSIGLAVLYSVLPHQAGITIEPWAIWSAFSVILVLSALLGRGGKSHVS